MMAPPVKNDDLNHSWITPDGNVTIKASEKKLVSLLSPIAMCVAGVLGNSLALFVLSRAKRERRRTVFYTLVATLAIVDMLGQLSTTPVVILTYVNNFQWVGGQALCEYFSFVMLFAGLTTLQVVCAMSIERFLALKHPFVSQKYLTYDKSKYVIFAILGVAFIFGLFPSIGIGSNARQFPGTWCFIRFIDTQSIIEKAYDYAYCCFGIFLILVTIMCNLSVALTMLQMCRSRQKRSMSVQSHLTEIGGNAPKRDRACDHSELQMLILLAGITSIFTICWSPLMVRILITLINPRPNDKISVLIVIRLASLNQVLDPWIYILFRKELLMRLKKALCPSRYGARSRVVKILMKEKRKTRRQSCVKDKKSRNSVQNDSCAREQVNMLDDSDNIGSTPNKYSIQQQAANRNLKNDSCTESSEESSADLTSSILCVCVQQNQTHRRQFSMSYVTTKVLTTCSPKHDVALVLHDNDRKMVKENFV
ncbi:prostaglandin E2 receptor EP3 subtype-like [Tubulanus polymorphus]|uniref:prostaglandin E2 receptor EP3 subtype-like n=1 Tax=Tubulanus polymorphus TaxID=672921 RepID=UPI003DA2412B